MTNARESVLRHFRNGHNRAAAFEPASTIFPGHSAPVIRIAQDGERELSVVYWGLSCKQASRSFFPSCFCLLSARFHRWSREESNR